MSFTHVTVTALPLCDLCRVHGFKELAHYDARMTTGVWANLCESHFNKLGVGLGLGRGQLLVAQSPVEL